MKPRHALCLGLLWAASSSWAQEVEPQWSGRLDTSYLWSEQQAEGVGLVTGWAGLMAGTKDVKSEIRLGLVTLPTPTVTLSRAWLKFRFPGVRVASGLGRVAWGPGFVLVPGDLPFDPGDGGDLDFGADELRGGGAWLADLWVALGDEAFVEAAALSQVLAARVSVAPAGITLEAASAWDREAGVVKVAASAQFHLGVDWYATLRYDAATDDPMLHASGLSAGAGAFGVWNLGAGYALSSRHEAWGIDPGPAPLLRTYHDLALASEDGWSLAARALVSDSWTPSVEARWSPLQNLQLWVNSRLNSPWAGSLGMSAKW